MPLTRISPPSGAKVPASRLISVDLPAPLWPTSPRHSPTPTVRSTLASARTAPKLFVMPERLTIFSVAWSMVWPVVSLLRCADDLLRVFQRVFHVGDAAG